MFQIIDVTGWERLNREQMGTKPKFWCLDENGHQFLFKESRTHSGEHWSEKVAAEIAESLGLPHAEIELAICDGKNGTISRNFLSPSEPSSLIHGNELLFEHDPDYPMEAPNFRLAQHTLDRIFSALTKTGVRLSPEFAKFGHINSACELFVGYLLLDALIVNTDRHHANWAVIAYPNQDGTLLFELAPTFDHASCLGRELTDQTRHLKLDAEQKRDDPKKPARRDQTVIGYLEKEGGRSRIYASEMDRKPLRPMQVFELARTHFESAADDWIDRLESVEMSIFESIFSQVSREIMSQTSRQFALCLIQLNRTALIERTFCNE